MDLISPRHLHSLPPLPSPSSSLSSSSHLSHTFIPFFLPVAYGKLKASPHHPHSFFITAVLADRPSAPTESASNCELRPALQQIESLEKQIALEAGVKRAGSPLKLQKKAAENEMGREDTELESKWVHRVWVAAGSSAMVGMMGKAMEAAGTTEERVGVIISAMGAYILADLATGIYHWGIDNYGDARTPIFGSQIDAFQGHHKRPWTITKRQFANNIHALARPATFALAPFFLLPSHAYVDSFLAAFLACVVYSQQFHAWAHAKKKDVPRLVFTLQELGLLVSRKMHGAHHRPPYNVNYCIVSGLWNLCWTASTFLPRWKTASSPPSASDLAPGQKLPSIGFKMAHTFPTALTWKTRRLIDMLQSYILADEYYTSAPT